jgi:hypothetical protein
MVTFMFLLTKVPRGSIEEELALVCRELETQPAPVYVPRLFLKLGLKTIRIAETHLNLDCGPTVGSDAAFIARNRVLADERAIAGWQDMRSAIYTSICTDSRQPEFHFSEESMDALIPDIAGFLQHELSGIDLALLIGNFHTGSCTTREIIPKNLKERITSRTPEPELEKLSAWVIQHEKIYNFRIYEVIAEYLKAYQHGIAQLRKVRGHIPRKYAQS